ncbi:hypothetical protein GCM10011371_34130 [Novosphingobium marinum]|uniref:Uncharacterized protein n=1 Tax=Novosphingobium marinum TaxID=1514948 RepID=A0A7Y9XYV4_9SPHN|nr:hypothetical protein [Novosphingobium marinum]NYH97137.1 hypothetical protein [Novosphingobium marinum]GGC43872.1 hypothetical protein GCM10011371_34130 [Novosphingobium marinum]
MLESHDPDWAAKFDDRTDRLRELERRMGDGLPDPDLLREYDNIAGAQRLAFDASHRTAQEYIDLHLSLTLREADLDGIWAWYPRLPASADLDATRAVVREVNGWVTAVKHNREMREVCQRAGITPDPTSLRSLPRLSWRTHFARLRWRLGRAKRLRRYQSHQES